MVSLVEAANHLISADRDLRPCLRTGGLKSATRNDSQSGFFGNGVGIALVEVPELARLLTDHAEFWLRHPSPDLD